MEDFPQITQVNPEAQAKLFEALSKAQAEYPDVPKSKVVKVRGKTKNGQPFEYEFKYAPLEEVQRALRKPFEKHGLSFFQRVVAGDGSDALLITTIGHKDGGWIADSMPITRSGDMKEFGGTITYAKRFALCAIAGISAEEDTENTGNGDRVTDISDTNPEIVEKIEAASTLPDLMKVWQSLSGAERKAHAHVKDVQKAFIQEVQEAENV